MLRKANGSHRIKIHPIIGKSTHMNFLMSNVQPQCCTMYVVDYTKEYNIEETVSALDDMQWDHPGKSHTFLLFHSSSSFM